MFARKYADVFKGEANWRKITVQGGLTYAWDRDSTYVQNPPYFAGMADAPEPLDDIVDARVLGLFLNSITTDHISPAGSIRRTPGGQVPADAQGEPDDFNQYGTRRGNHEVMMRGTFANIRIKNQMVPGVEGGVTIHYPSERARCRSTTPRCDTRPRGVPLVVFAGKEYGTGSSRDWAAKGTKLLGIRAVIAQIVRAHPPLQPDRHGRDPTGVRGRHVLADRSASRASETGHDPRPARRTEAAPAADRRDRRGRRRASSACR